MGTYDRKVIDELHRQADEAYDLARRWRDLANLNERLATEWRGRFELIFTALDDDARDAIVPLLRTYDEIVSRPEVPTK